MVLSTDVKLGTFIAEVVIPAVVITGGDVSNTTAVEQPKGAVSAEVVPRVVLSAEVVPRVLDSTEVLPSVVISTNTVSKVISAKVVV